MHWIIFPNFYVLLECSLWGPLNDLTPFLRTTYLLTAWWGADFIQKMQNTISDIKITDYTLNEPYRFFLVLKKLLNILLLYSSWGVKTAVLFWKLILKLCSEWLKNGITTLVTVQVCSYSWKTTTYKTFNFGSNSSKWFFSSRIMSAPLIEI